MSALLFGSAFSKAGRPPLAAEDAVFFGQAAYRNGIWVSFGPNIVQIGARQLLEERERSTDSLHFMITQSPLEDTADSMFWPPKEPDPDSGYAEDVRRSAEAVQRFLIEVLTRAGTVVLYSGVGLADEYETVHVSISSWASRFLEQWRLEADVPEIRWEVSR